MSGERLKLNNLNRTSTTPNTVLPLVTQSNNNMIVNMRVRFSFDNNTFFKNLYRKTIITNPAPINPTSSSNSNPTSSSNSNPSNNAIISINNNMIYNNYFLGNDDNNRYQIIVGASINNNAQEVVAVSNLYNFNDLPQFSVSIPSPTNATINYKYDYYLYIAYYENNSYTYMLIRLELIDSFNLSNKVITLPQSNTDINNIFNPYVYKDNKICGMRTNPLTFVISPEINYLYTFENINFKHLIIQTKIPISLRTNLLIAPNKKSSNIIQIKPNEYKFNMLKYYTGI